MGRFKEEIMALNANAGNMGDDEFSQKVLASVAAHLAETTQKEESYYTHLAKFELITLPKILATSTVVSSMFSSDVDPLQEVREKNTAVKKVLSDNLAACVAAIKVKMEKQAASFEKTAAKYDDKSSEEEGKTVNENSAAFRKNAEQTRAQALLYDAHQEELNHFFRDPSKVLSKEAASLLGELRRYTSTTQNLPKSFADWNALVIQASKSPKSSDPTVKASILSLSVAINHYHAAVENIMRERMAERTTVNDFQQIVKHIAEKASNIQGEKEAAEKTVISAQLAVEDAKKALESAERKLKEEQENAKKREQEAKKRAEEERQTFVTLSQAPNGLTQKPAFDTGSVVSFATYKTTRSSRNIAKGLIETSAITDAQNMEQHAGWTHSKVVILQNLRLQYNLELYKEENGNGTSLPTVTTNGHTHRDFIGRGEKMSARMFSFIADLADEMISPLNVIKALDKHYPKLEVTQTLARIQKTYTQDLEDPDELPGFIINKNPSQDDVKMMYYKVSMLSNMWGNDEELSMLPYNKEKAEKYGKIAEEMEQKYTYLLKNRDEKLVVTSTVTKK